MTLILLALPLIAAGLISFALTPIAGRIAHRVGALDQPGPRKVHQRPIPRLGGLAVVAAIVVVSACRWWLAPAGWGLSGRLLAGVGLGLLPIVGVSILDDIRTLRAGPKFLAHLAGAVIAVWFGVALNGEVHLFDQTIGIGLLAFPLSVLWIVGVTNAFNIVDGLDGLSSGLALISAMSLAAVFLLAGETGMAGAVLVLAGALGGFLPHNVYPARMFLGDTGAAAVGFCLAAAALKGGATLSAGFATLLPVFVMGLPIAETLISMLRRAMRRLTEKDAGGVFEPDRNHMHHRLLALGIDHQRAVFILYGAGLLLAGGALVSMFMTAGEAALLVVALLLAGFLGVQRLGYDEFAVIRSGAALRMYEAPVLKKSMFVVFVDLLIVAASACAAVALKTDDWSLVVHRGTAFAMVAVLAPITVAVFWQMGLYRGTWRLAGVDEFVRAACAVLVASLLGLSLRMLLAPAEPAAALFSIYALLAIFAVTGSRASYQVLAASHRRAASAGAPALIYGAGRKGVTAVRELVSDAGGALRPVAFIDDDPRKAGRLVNGMPVVGSSRSLERAIRGFAARAVIVASDTVPDARLEALRDVCERMDVALLKMQISIEACAQGDGALRLSLARADAPAVAPPAPAAATGLRPRPALNLHFADTPLPRGGAPLAAGVRCPQCRSLNVRRSHVNGVTERLRKRLSAKRLHRCEDCGWRGWQQAIDTAVYQSLPLASPRSVKWDSIDATFSAGRSGKLAS
jgi:UDP-GlcNAc:undecaprenyl-phosphate GlcNAc-1-phosphate transferase